MTIVEFHKYLYKIDFKNGSNIQRLEDYLLACLVQLDIYKLKKPSYELFLLIFDQARNGQKADFDSSWKERYDPEKQIFEYPNLKEWEIVRDGLRFLTHDLISTRIIRSQPNYEKSRTFYEWESEGGITFYNGITPDAILRYAATRFEGEYPERALQKKTVTWTEFTHPIWTGISYE